MITKKRFLFFLLIVLCIIFLYFIKIIPPIEEEKGILEEIHKNDINLAEIESTLYQATELDINLTLWDVEPYYNPVENTYYFLISEEYYQQKLKPKVKILPEETALTYKYSILNEDYNKEDGLTIKFNEPYEMIVYDESTYYKIPFKITNLPIINIFPGVEEITTDPAPAIFQIYMKDYDDNIGTSFITSETMIYVRGRSSLYYPKKQYRLKLRKDNDYNEVSLLGMEADEDWILDSLYADNSKIRNKLSFDLWNQMNSYAPNKYDNDLEMDYVDVYINNEYHGMYLLKEFYDRKKLELEKNSEEDSGILLKGIQYGEIDWDNYENAKHSQDVFPFILKYPKNLPDHAKYWDTILPKVYTNFFEKDKITKDYILNNFFISNYIDYNWLINFIYAADNFEEKNVYLSMKNMKEDTKVLITPWDLDMTYGYMWGASDTNLVEDSTLVTDASYLWTNSDYINKKLKNRYWDLRWTIFTEENINSKIDSYYNKIRHSAKRDSQKWIEIDLEEEINKVKDWVNQRIDFLDEEVKNK